MLSHEDYQRLKKSTKGWGSRKLLEYGVGWPPVKGWRTRLLREFEGRPLRPIPTQSPTRATDDLLEGLATRQMKLQAYWYDRMSGKLGWQAGERAILEANQDKLSLEIAQLIGRMELKMISAERAL